MKTKILFQLFISFLFVSLSYAADGVFTNLRATNAKFTNLSAANSKVHGTLSGTFTGTGTLNAPIFFNCTSHSLSYTLPSTGGMLSVIKQAPTAYTLTINPSAGSTIQGLSSYILYLSGESANFYYSNSIWYLR